MKRPGVAWRSKIPTPNADSGIKCYYFKEKIIERDARDDGKNDGWREQGLIKSRDNNWASLNRAPRHNQVVFYSYHSPKWIVRRQQLPEI